MSLFENSLGIREWVTQNKISPNKIKIKYYKNTTGEEKKKSNRLLGYIILTTAGIDGIVLDKMGCVCIYV